MREQGGGSIVNLTNIGGKQPGARFPEGAGARNDDDQGGEEHRPDDAELRPQKLKKGGRMEEPRRQSGIVAQMQIADEAMAPVPPQIGQINQPGDAGGGA